MFVTHENSTSHLNGTSEGIGSSNVTSPAVEPRRAVTLALVLGAFIIFAIAGNILVVLSVVCNKHLRTVTNYFIINLASADLLLSTTVLPFSATFEILGYWVFGRIFCDIWAALDVLCCTASIMSLCAISIDRYIGVSYPLRYPTIMTERRVLLILIAVWVLAIVISVGPLLGWKEPAPPDETVCEITEVPGYALFSAMGSFYIPLVILLAMYCRVYVAARRQTKSLEEGIKRERSSSSEEVTLRIHRRTIAPGEDSLRDTSKGPHFRSSLSVRFMKFSREKKAAKTLGIVVGVFILCWLPFFIALPIGSFFPSVRPSQTVFKVVFWLGYFNSCINPLIYPCSSQEFKRAFLRALRCHCREGQRRRRQPWGLHHASSSGSSYSGGRKGSSHLSQLHEVHGGYSPDGLCERSRSPDEPSPNSQDSLRGWRLLSTSKALSGTALILERANSPQPET
ncbi:alpha-1A adrenergic receptor-like [Petromyzon marinus]|uniref:alpha-1A adrenergic receptor-like n=1 Tax=Petromyzon marinus TaxID=7757 RepID=UPI003F6FE5BC